MAPFRLRALRPRAILLCVLTAFACTESSSLFEADPQFNKGGGKGGTKSSSDPSVSAVDPSVGQQGQIIAAIRISGNGFESNAQASWEIGGVPAAGITVLATRFVSSTLVEADIAIAADADLNLYDVAVTMGPGGKRGVGIEMFEVTNTTATWLLPADDSELAFRHDGLNVEDGFSVYAHGQCNVSTVLYAGWDATIRVDKGKGKNSCSRTFTLRYSDGVIETGTAFSNLREVQSPIIPVGQMALRTLAINVGAINNSRCGRLLFGVGRHGGGVGSDSVIVHRTNARTWHVQSQEGHTLALCENNDTLYEMPVSFMIVADTDVL